MGETEDKSKNLRITRNSRKTVKSVLRKEKGIYGGNDLLKR